MLSPHYNHWVSTNDSRRCASCEDMHGKIYALSERADPSPPLHPHCRCQIRRMEARQAGTATGDGRRGADWYLKRYGTLPEYYLCESADKRLGWVQKRGNLSSVAPGKMFGGEIYHNRNDHLPSAPGRIWYEADINYRGGFRGTDRILFSSDGLIFVTYDHYRSFIEIL